LLFREKIRESESRDKVYTVPFVMQLVRPVMNVTDAVQVQFKLKISQLIDVVSLPKIGYNMY
jgi:hypothetical protein